MSARARSEGVSALSRGEDGDAPACFSGESNDSHVERVTSHVSAAPMWRLQHPLQAFVGPLGLISYQSWKLA